MLSGRTADLDITVIEDRGNGVVYGLCKRVGSEGAMKTLSVECQQPLRGRYLRLERLRSGFHPNLINIWEIQVYGYLYSGNFSHC